MSRSTCVSWSDTLHLSCLATNTSSASHSPLVLQRRCARSCIEVSCLLSLLFGRLLPQIFERLHFFLQVAVTVLVTSSKRHPNGIIYHFILHILAIYTYQALLYALVVLIFSTHLNKRHNSISKANWQKKIKWTLLILTNCINTGQSREIIAFIFFVYIFKLVKKQVDKFQGICI